MQPPEKTVPKHTKAIAYLLAFITFILVVYILMALREILIPVTIAIFLTFLFHPLVIIFRKVGIPKWVTILTIFLTVAGLNYLFGLLLFNNIEPITSKLEFYLNNFSNIVQDIIEPLGISIWQFSKIVGIDLARIDGDSVFQQLFELGIVEWLFSTMTGVFGDFFLSLIFWVFMMAGKLKFEERLKVAFAEGREAIASNIESIDYQLQNYLIIKTLLSLITGLLTWGILAAYDVDFALFWGILTFVMNYIPHIGSTIATIAPVLVAILAKGFGWPVVSMTVLLLGVHNIIGNLIEPHYMGKQMDLSPVFVLFSLIFWGWVWGVVGMFLAVPIAAAIKILFSNIEPLKPIGIILGNKPLSIVIPETKIETKIK